MAETPSKRLREESHQEVDGSGANSKRQKPYNNILNLLDEDEAEASQEPSHELSQDLSAIFTTLQQELSSSTTTAAFDLDSLPSTGALEEAEQSQHQDPSAKCGGGNEDDGVTSVMRHLLEASDDELGIPNTKDDENDFGILNSGENFPLWELEDVAANYYSILQGELFM